MSKITEVPFSIEEHTAYEIAEFWVEHKKKVTNSPIEYLEELIYSLEYAKCFFQSQEDEQS